MPKYSCDVDIMRSKAQELLQQTQKLRNISDSINKVIYSTGDEWKGEAATAFVQSFDQRKLEINNFYTLLEDYARLVSKTADDYEATDNRVARLIRSSAG